MRWSNKIINCNEDRSLSRISSREMSKFKKVNLKASQQEFTSQNHAEKSDKSLLILTSVQKIKPSHLNKSYISNYMNSSHTLVNINQDVKVKAGEKQKILSLASQTGNNFNINILCSKQDVIGDKADSESNNYPTHQGYSVFGNVLKDTQAYGGRGETTRDTKALTEGHKQKLKNILFKIKDLVLQFQDISQSIKKQADNTTTEAYTKIQNQLSKFLRQFQTRLQLGINQIINLSNNFRSEQIKVSWGDGVSLPRIESENFHKVQNFQEVSSQEQNAGKQHQLGRANTFKNRFKQMLSNCDQNLVVQGKIQKIGGNLLNQNDKLQRRGNHFQSQKSSAKKILRKRTNPSPRLNSFIGNESSILNPHNQSSNSIRYRKLNDRSASKSLKRLQQKIGIIKNIYNSSVPSNNKGETSKILVQNE